MELYELSKEAKKRMKEVDPNTDHKLPKRFDETMKTIIQKSGEKNLVISSYIRTP